MTDKIKEATLQEMSDIGQEKEMNIKELAEQAGINFGGHPMNPLSVYFSELKRFAELVAAAASAKEREACAKVCEDASHWDGHIATQCAQRIRARGDKHE